jgi:glycosyltransferase involved in cell wall biosynthesis
VTFAGRRDDIREILGACSVAIHPSNGEVGYSLSILEYMEAGLPTLVPSNPSVCEATRHEYTGLVYKNGDLESALESLLRLLADEQLRLQLGSQGKADVRNRYDLGNAQKELLHAFSASDPQYPPDAHTKSVDL